VCRRLLPGRLFGGILGRSVLLLGMLWCFVSRGGVLWWCLGLGLGLRLRRRFWFGAGFRWFSGFLRCRLWFRLVRCVSGWCFLTARGTGGGNAGEPGFFRLWGGIGNWRLYGCLRHSTVF